MKGCEKEQKKTALSSQIVFFLNCVVIAFQLRSGCGFGSGLCHAWSYGCRKAAETGNGELSLKTAF